jgi:hypothetical protein
LNIPLSPPQPEFSIFCQKSTEFNLSGTKYIDLNMVRASVVGHPKDWQNSGDYEIQNPKQR